MEEEKNLITEAVDAYRKNNSRDNFKAMLKTIIENADKYFTLPLDVRVDQNALELKSVFKDNKSYILAYSDPKQMFGNKEGELATMSIENVIKKVLSNDYWDGIWINPDPFITPENNDNQCIISKDEIIKMIDKLYKK